MDSFPPPHTKQNLQITLGLYHIPHHTYTQAAPFKTIWDYRSTLWQHLVVGLTRHQAKPVGREHIRQANTQAASYNGRYQHRIHLQKPLNCCYLLLHKKKVLHFYMNPDIKWNRIQLDGLKQLRQLMKHITCQHQTRLLFPLTTQQGKVETLKENSWDSDRRYRTPFLLSYEVWAPLLSDNKTSRAQRSISFQPFSIWLCALMSISLKCQKQSVK